MPEIRKKEQERQRLQFILDKLKSQQERNALGQYSTPFQLAWEILIYAKANIRDKNNIRFFDPAFGTGVFYSALTHVFLEEQIKVARGFEIDTHYFSPAFELWKNTKLELGQCDFTKQVAPKNTYNLIICNPPYIRHHLIQQKEYLKRKAFNVANVNLTGFASLYCYFLVLSHPWLMNGGMAVWLIPSEFMDVNYGKEVKKYLLNEVTLLHIHRYDPDEVQFEDVLVSSAIVCFRKERPDLNHCVKFTYGGSLETPQVEKVIEINTLRSESKWTRFPLLDARKNDKKFLLSDYFEIKRGIATGDNNYFILTREKIEEKKLPIDQFKPILPSPRFLDRIEITSDSNGYPLLKKQLFVLDCDLPIERVKEEYPELYRYLKDGFKSGVADRYLCRKRKIWYSQEKRNESPFYFTYIGRTKSDRESPFRFILNESKAIVSNSYLILYPKKELEIKFLKKPSLKKEVLILLNNLTCSTMLEESRVYGGGMYKMEPGELARVSVSEIDGFI